MKLQAHPVSSLDLSWDFHPRRPFPHFLPPLAVRAPDGLRLVSGFERVRHQKDPALIEVGTIESDPTNHFSIFSELYGKSEDLAPLERLRFQVIVQKIKGLSAEPLVRLPIDYQNWLDDRELALKSLLPFLYLEPLWPDLSQWMVQLGLSSSQARQALDLICDLHGRGEGVSSLKPISGENSEQWLRRLNVLRNPMALGNDQKRQEQVAGRVVWPNGVQAQWERHGDQAGLSLKLHVSSSQQWLTVNKKLRDLEQTPEFHALWRGSTTDEL